METQLKMKTGKKVLSYNVSADVGNYEKHPFFGKKAKEAKALIESVGLPRLSKEK